eukprot:snap_masked-scaffold_3-processed-gene-16.32-mRNA-1 protein AED:1.00 eAED:1.00 QI:0/-1/0/0/-1/1/1/0/796
MAGKKKLVHAQRLKYYCGSWMEVDELVKSAWLYNEGKFEVEEFIGVKSTEDGYLLLTRWKGFESFVPTWERLADMLREVPEQVKLFLKSSYGGRRAKEEISRIIHGTAKAVMKAGMYQFVVLRFPIGMAALSESVRPGLSRSKGWTDKERHVLDCLIQAKGFGDWKGMLKTGALPGKTKSQIITEVQRLIKSQRIAHFAGLRMTTSAIRAFNDLQPGNRRNGVLVGSFRKLPHDEVERKKREIYAQLEEQQKPLELKDIPKLRPAEVSNLALTTGDVEMYLEFLSTGFSCVVRQDHIKKDQFNTRGWCKVNDKWLEVDTLLDSGSTFTCGARDRYGDQVEIKSGDAVHNKLRSVELANQEIRSTIGYITVDLKIEVSSRYKKKTIIIPDTHVYLFEGSFADLLIGKDVLRRLGATPEQRILGCDGIDGRVCQGRAVDYISEWEELLKTEREREVYRKKLVLEMKELCENVPHYIWFEKSKIRKNGWIFQQNGEHHFLGKRENDRVPLEFEVWIQPMNSRIYNLDVFEFVSRKEVYDVVVIDYPWRGPAANAPTRGMTLSYETLPDSDLFKIPIAKLVPNGHVCIWTLPSKLKLTTGWLIKYDFEIEEVLAWIKKTRLGKNFTTQGGLLLHNKELMIIAKRGKPKRVRRHKHSDVLYAPYRYPSRKPTEVYALIENLFPESRKLELFGRRWNCRSKWTTVGKEVLSTGTLEGGSFDLRSSLGIGSQSFILDKSWAEVAPYFVPYALNTLYYKSVVVKEKVAENIKPGQSYDQGALQRVPGRAAWTNKYEEKNGTQTY